MTARALVHHPGSNHLAYELVAALQASGIPTDFDTGFFYTDDGLAARLARLLPANPRAAVERELLLDLLHDVLRRIMRTCKGSLCDMRTNAVFAASAFSLTCCVLIPSSFIACASRRRTRIASSPPGIATGMSTPVVTMSPVR